MRKYYQAALAVTAVVSLVSLLIYRHEYNKLRYVLEVFNYFGKPGKVDANCTSFNSTFIAFNLKFDEPIPSWQRLEDDLYVYSAYSVNYQRYKEIRAVGLATINSVLNTQCLVFFESESKPILGSFKFIPIGKLTSNVEGSKYRGYHFVCTYTSSETPTGITFVTKSNKYLNYAPIFPIKTQSQSLSDSRIGVCVIQSSMKPMQPTDMIGFISFHALMGMDNFIVYDSGIPYEFNIRLKELANDPTSLQKFTYTIIPWNFPFMDIDQSVIRDIAEIDCLYRTYNNVAYTIVLSWNEYIVLKYHRAIVDLVKDMKRIETSIDRFRLKAVTFCTQQADNKQYVNSTLLVLKKTKLNKNTREDFPVYIQQPHKILQAELQNFHIIRTKEIRKNLVTVNQYKHCDDRKSQEVEDTTILRFAQDVQNSWIFRKYRELYDMPFDIK